MRHLCLLSLLFSNYITSSLCSSSHSFSGWLFSPLLCTPGDIGPVTWVHHTPWLTLHPFFNCLLEIISAFSVQWRHSHSVRYNFTFSSSFKHFLIYLEKVITSFFFIFVSLNTQHVPTLTLHVDFYGNAPNKQKMVSTFYYLSLNVFCVNTTQIICIWL